jgi:hypothetical protein
MKILDESTREQFMRIAMARLKPHYRFKPQRLAIASKMYVKFLEKKNT